MFLRYTTVFFAAAMLLEGCQTIEHRNQEVRIPVNGTETKLVSTVFYPKGEGPFPVAILNHGTPSSGSKRAQMGKWLKAEPINALVGRGFAVMVPMRRGFGATGGRYSGSIGSCKNPDFYNGSLRAAENIVAAINHAKTLPSIDPSRVLLVGQSAGSIASLAAASVEPNSVRAVANFSGGRGSGRSSSTPGVPCYPERMAEAIGNYAKGITVPVLWYYAENDTYFSPPVVRDWFESFQRNGGRGELIIQPPFGNDGHFVLTNPGGAKHWGPALDRFLAANGFQVQ